MDEVVHLEVKAGPEAGRQITIPPEGARLGRSKRNEICVDDDRLSRHHSRFYFKEGRLYVQDLDSANETLVNDRPVQDVRLALNDIVSVGSTTLKVLHDGERTGLRLRSAAAPLSPTPLAPSEDLRSRVDGVLEKERPLTLLVRAPAWILMALWWCFLAYSLMAPDTRPPGADQPTAPASPSSVPEAPPSLPTSPDEMAQRLGELGVTSDQLSQMSTLKRVVADRLAQEDYGKAMELIGLAAAFQTAPENREAAVELGRFVHEISQVNTLVASAFLRNIGSELLIRHGDRRVRFVPKAVAGHQVSGTHLSDAGERVITFNVSSLTPAERSRWLGKAKTPAQCAMQCILQMEAGDYQAARLLASNSGPLARALLARAEGPPDS